MALPHRHRPRHHQQRPGLHRPAAQPRRGGRIDIQPFPVPQLVAPGEVADRPLLPSFLYLPGPHDLPPGADRPAVGRRAATTPSASSPATTAARCPAGSSRSAKSWLCHAGVDRSAAAAAVERPAGRAAHLAASRRRRATCATSSRLELRHGQGPARGPAGEAGRRPDRAGVVRRRGPQPDRRGGRARPGWKTSSLLEEPQAAFYCWLATHSAAGGRPRSSRARAAWSWTWAAAPATSA